MIDIIVHAHSLLLLPERAIFWPAERALLIADIHFGKAAAFRAQGLPVPSGTTTENLQQLDALITRHAAEEIIFLGDFLHAKTSHAPSTLSALRQWRARHPTLRLSLVRGNHDLAAGEPPLDLAIDVVDEPWQRGPFALCHHPDVRSDAYVLAGHIHPSFRLGGRGGDSVRLPCFWFGETVGVLPAFGSFTGGYPVRPQDGDRLFVVTPERVFAVPSPQVLAS